MLSFAVLLTARQTVSGYAARVPRAALALGRGVMGLIVILSITFATPRIGAAATIGLLIAGQLAMGAVIDRFGSSGWTRSRSAGSGRARDSALLAVGAALSLRK